jgi:hypothetical protein
VTTCFEEQNNTNLLILSNLWMARFGASCVATEGSTKANVCYFLKKSSLALDCKTLVFQSYRGRKKSFFKKKKN